MEDPYNTQIYSISSGWLQSPLDEDYVYSFEFSPQLIPFIIFLQQIVLGLLADPDYQEDF